MRLHIQACKAQGLKVMLEPQVCCNSPPWEQTFGETWYQAWFDQYEAFLLYHAQIAADEGVDSIVLDWQGVNVSALPSSPNALPWFEQRWRDLMTKVRNVYGGTIGYSIHVGHAFDESYPVGSLPKLQPILDLFDFLGVAIWAGLAGSNEDTQEQINARVTTLFDSVLKPIYDDTGLPLILSSVAYGSYDGAARSKLGVYEVGLVAWFPEQDSEFVNDPIEQAVVYQAIMQAVADRPYITGVFPFGYPYLALPVSTDYGIRGKPAEQVLSAWYAHSVHIFKSGFE